MLKILTATALLALPLLADDPAATATSADTKPAPAAPLQYNVDQPYGDQRHPIYYTDDMTFGIGTTQIGFYGFIKADYLGETRITGNTGDVYPNTVPIDTDLPDVKTQSLLDARSSRFGMTLQDTFEGIKMKAAVEADFYTTDSAGVYGNSVSTNSRLLRLRLSYATAELPSHFFFLVGQYYGLPMHYPEIDMPTRVNLIHYPVGVVDSRQPQFRLGYKQYLSKTSLFQYEVNAESQGYNNASGFITAEGGTTTQASEQKNGPSSMQRSPGSATPSSGTSPVQARKAMKSSTPQAQESAPPFGASSRTPATPGKT